MSKQINQIYEFGDFRLETAEQLLLRRGKPIPLTRKAFETLFVLVQNSGHLVEKDELMKRVWADAFVEEANLARNVWALRKALDDDTGEHRYIVTVPKRGYRFVAPVREVPGVDAGILIQRRIKARIVSEEEERTDQPQSETSVTYAKSQPVEAVAGRKQFAARRAAAILMAVPIVLALLVLVAGVWFLRRPEAPSKISSIAVLPLRSLDEEENSKALGLGLTDALITKLGSLRMVAVRPTSAVVNFAGSDLDPLEIGKRLKTDAVLEGTIQQSEGRIRVNARLVNVATGAQIWAERFDESTNELFALQDALSNKIARTLAFQLEKSKLEQLASRPTKNPAAYESYLRGRFYQTQNNEPGLSRSIKFYEQAISLDPDFADAYAGLADANLLLSNFGLRQLSEVVPKARESLNHALELNPNLPSVYNSLALIQLFSERDWKAAEHSLQKALDLDPNNADAFLRYGYFLVLVGRFDEALVKLERARELNPLSPIVEADIGLAYLSARRYPEANEQLERVATENPEFSLAYWFLGAAYEANGEVEKGFAADLKALEAEGHGELASRLRSLKETKGLSAANQLWLDESLQARQHGYIPALIIASLYATLKNREQTLAWLDKAYEEGDRTLSQIKYLPKYDFLRDDPRFQLFLKKIDFEQR